MQEFTVDPKNQVETVKFIQSFTAGKCSPKRRRGVRYLTDGMMIVAEVIPHSNHFKVDKVQRYYLSKDELAPVAKNFLLEGRAFCMRTGRSDGQIKVRFSLKKGKMPERKKVAPLIRIISDIYDKESIEKIKAGTHCICCGGDKTPGAYSCAKCFSFVRSEYGVQALSKAIKTMDQILDEIKKEEKISLIENPEKETLLRPILANVHIGKKAVWKKKEKYYRSILYDNGAYVAVYVKGLSSGMQGETVACFVTGKYNGRTGASYVRAQFVPGIRSSVKLASRPLERHEELNLRLPYWEIDESVNVMNDNDEKEQKDVRFVIGFANV